jgi:tetratricopeptide (TPR) repeat protein
MQRSHTIIVWLVAITLLLSPLLFIPLFPNAHILPKTALILLTTCLAIIIYFGQTLTFHKTKLNLPLFLIFLTTTVNLIINSEARAESFYGKGFLLLILTTLAFLITQLNLKKELINLTTLLTSLGTTLLALFTILHLTFLHNQAWLPLFMQTRLFTPTGSLLSTTIILGVGLAIATASALKLATGRPFYIISASLQLIAFAGALSLILPQGEFATNLLPFSASWSLFLDSAKSLPQLLFGVGLSNFDVLFAFAKPLFLNQTIFWEITPDGATSELLTLLTTGGLLLSLSFALFALTTARVPNTTTNLPLKLGFLLTLASLIFLPGHLILYLMLFVFGSSLIPSQNTYALPTLSKELKLGLALIALALALVPLYFFGRVALAEHNLYLASVALAKDNVQEVYDKTLAAVLLLPNQTSYRTSYSQLNLALASSLSQKDGELTEAEREQITQLVSIAIREARVATTLRPSLSSVWSNLGNIYKNLVGVAEGSENFAIEYYGTAVARDASNPALRVEFGGLFYQLASSPLATNEAVKISLLTRAAEQFQFAINLKGDYANAYYNLGKTYELAGDYQTAIEALTITLNLLPDSSPDKSSVQAELETLKNKLEARGSQATELQPIALPNTPPSPNPETSSAELTSPEPLPEPILTEPIVLPEENLE